MINGLIPDGRWEILYKITSYEEFLRKIIPRFYFNKRVHSDILSIFKVVQNALYLSYYEYELLDMACLKAYLSLEVALKLRYLEITNSIWPQSKPLVLLIKWFREEGYFEVDNTDFLNHVRLIRNLLTHQTRHSVSGPLSLNHTKVVVDLINDIYEDRLLRQERKSLTQSYNNCIQNFIEGGSVLTLKSGEQFLIYFMTVGFIDNSKKPPEIFVFFKSIFDLPENFCAADTIEIWPCRRIIFSTLIETDEDLIGQDIYGYELFRLSVVRDLETKNKWLEWKTSFKKYNEVIPWFFSVNMRDVDEEISSIWDKFRGENQGGPETCT